MQCIRVFICSIPQILLKHGRNEKEFKTAHVQNLLHNARMILLPSILSTVYSQELEEVAVNVHTHKSAHCTITDTLIVQLACTDFLILEKFSSAYGKSFASRLSLPSVYDSNCTADKQTPKKEVDKMDQRITECQQKKTSITVSLSWELIKCVMYSESIEYGTCIA